MPLDDTEPDPQDVEGHIEQVTNEGILTGALRGYLGYAFSETDKDGTNWLVLLYPKEKRAIRISTVKMEMFEYPYYEQTRH